MTFTPPTLAAPPAAMDEPPSTSAPVALRAPFGVKDAEEFEASVVPDYLRLFAEPLVESIAPGTEARVCHLDCRTGYPGQGVLAKLPNAHLYGCDVSADAIQTARSNAARFTGCLSDYRVHEASTTPFPAGAFSHAFTLYAAASPPSRRRLLDELARLVAPRGQALVGMPLRESFVELSDLLCECGLKNELAALTRAVEAAALFRPTAALFANELEHAGFEYVDVQERRCTLRFNDSRAWFEAPAMRQLVIPELRQAIPLVNHASLAYVREAIDKYWSREPFELTVHVGIVSGRRKS